MPEIKDVPIGKIHVGEHAQRMEAQDEDLDSLVASIGRVGMLVPIVAVRKKDGFVVVAGHRRLRAAVRLGMRTVPVIVQEMEAAKRAEVSFAENMFRKDLSPLELGCAVKDCLDNKIMTVEELVGGLHRTAEWIRRMVAMLDWPEEVLQAIHIGSMSISAAHNLAMVDDDTYRAFLVKNAVEQGATARTTAAWLQAYRAMQPAELAVTAEPGPGGSPPQPMVPQAPCLCCGDVFRTDELSHVPVCARCIQAIRSIGQSG